MDELIRNLETYELKIQQDQGTKERNKKKYLDLIARKLGSSEVDEDVDYLAQIFMRDMKRNVGFKREKKRSTTKPLGGNDYCHKYGKIGYFIKDYPMHKMEYKDYAKT